VPCRIMKREVFADDEVAERIGRGFIAVTVDRNAEGAAELMTRYGINFTPTTVITDAEGNALRGTGGKLSKEEFLQLLD
jgi:thioredoxin 1